MGAKDIRVALANFEEKVMGNKGKPLVTLYPDCDRKFGIIPTGVPEIDEATGIGGFPRGRIVELFGPESSGKSWVGYCTIGQAQRMGLRTVLIDVEGAYDPIWASASAGVDPTKLIYGNDFEHGEQAMEYVKGLCVGHAADLIMIDSTAALVPKVEAEAKLEDNQMARLAAMMSRACRNINAACIRSNTLVIFINQLRSKVGIVFGNPETTPGGSALKFYSSMRVDIRKVAIEFEEVGEGDDKEKIAKYLTSKVNVVKSKVGRPGGRGEFQIFFDKDANTPQFKLVSSAIDLKVFGNRRADEEGVKVYAWGKGKDAELTGAENVKDLAEWIIENRHIAELVTMVKDAAETKGQKIDPTLLALTDEAQVVEVAEPVEAAQ